MKSERRHDLETNDLAVRMKDAIEGSKPYLLQIVGGAAIVVLLFALWTAWGSTSSATEQEAWDKFLLASYSSDPEMLDMKRLAENSDYSGTTVPEWAYLMWCDRQLLLASQTYLADRSATTSRLKKIQGIYESLATSATVAQIRDRAKYGLAQVYEMQDKLGDAESKYEQVTGDLTPLASNRAEQLKIEEVQESCKWLATAELPKRETPRSSTTKSGSRPSFEAEVPGSLSTPGDIQDTRSLEEILTGSVGSGGDEDRYGTEAADETTSEEQDAESDEETSDGQ